MTNSKRRFIAGAVCPRCAAMDTVYVFKKNEQDVRACTDCNFEETANFASSKKPAPQKELPTRVNQTVDKTVVEIQKIKLIDNLKE